MQLCIYLLDFFCHFTLNSNQPLWGNVLDINFVRKCVSGITLWCPLRFSYKNDVFLPPSVYRRAHVLFTLFVFACEKWCPTHIVSCFYSGFLRIVYHMLPVSLVGPILIAPSVFSNVYILHHYENTIVINCHWWSKIFYVQMYDNGLKTIHLPKTRVPCPPIVVHLSLAISRSKQQNIMDQSDCI